MEITSYLKGAIVVFSIGGEVDANTAPQAQQAIMTQLAAGQQRIVLDMEHVSYLSSAGLRMLLAVVREARRLNGDVRLARLQPAVEDTIAMGFSKMIKTYGSLPGALSSYGVANASDDLSDSRWSDSFLDEMRMIGDPVADAAIQCLFEEGSIEAVNRLMKDLVSNDYVPPSSLPAVIREYLANTADLPDWADSVRIRRGQAVFSRYGVQMVMILFHGSLPMSYAAAKGVHVLAMTNRLNKNPYRRILETAQMLMDIMASGGLEPSGNGRRSAQKVRLMHAAVRHLLLASGHWDTAEYGMPINQEDLVGTLGTFSYLITSSLPKLGIELTHEQQEDYQHVWNVAAHILGLVPEIIPQTLDDAHRAWEPILRRQIMPSTANPEGKELTAHLLELIRNGSPAGHYHAIPQALMRYLLGDTVANQIGIEQTSWEHALKPLQWANHIFQETGDVIPLMGRMTQAFSYKLLEGFMLHNLGGNRTAFQIPHSLREDWGLSLNADNASI